MELVKPATEEFNCAFTQLVRTRPPPENVPRFIEHATPSERLPTETLSVRSKGQTPNSLCPSQAGRDASAVCVQPSFGVMKIEEHEIGPPRIFISHTWRNKWGLLVAAISDVAKSSKADPTKLTVWVDAFAINQHSRSMDELDDLEARRAVTYVTYVTRMSVTYELDDLEPRRTLPSLLPTQTFSHIAGAHMGPRAPMSSRRAPPLPLSNLSRSALHRRPSRCQPISSKSATRRRCPSIASGASTR